MERFICYDKGHRQECEAFPDPNGEYVRHEAHIAAVRELEAENALLRAKVARLEAPVSDEEILACRMYAFNVVICIMFGLAIGIGTKILDGISDRAIYFFWGLFWRFAWDAVATAD